MAIITPPAPLPLRGARWRLRVPGQTNRSGWTGRRRYVGLPGASIWLASGTFVAVLGAAEAKPWKAFFLKLRGTQNSFPVEAVEVQQTAADNPTVASGAGSGTTLPLKGLPTSATVLEAGDMMTVVLPSGHHRLVGLTADLVSGSGGTALAQFEPELGEAPEEDAAVEIQWPYGLMNLTSAPPGWDVEPGQEYRFEIDSEEAL